MHIYVYINLYFVYMSEDAKFAIKIIWYEH